MGFGEVILKGKNGGQSDQRLVGYCQIWVRRNVGPKYSGGSGQRKEIKKKKTFQRQTQQDLIRAKEGGKDSSRFCGLGYKKLYGGFQDDHKFLDSPRTELRSNSLPLESGTGISDSLN